MAVVSPSDDSILKKMQANVLQSYSVWLAKPCIVKAKSISVGLKLDRTQEVSLLTKILLTWDYESITVDAVPGLLS